MTQHAWTPLIGLRRAALHVMLRSVLVITAWALLLWCVAPALNFFALAQHPRAIWLLGALGLISSIPGACIGFGLAHKITDIAGMEGASVAVIVIAGAWLSIWGGAVIATHLQPIADFQLAFVCIATALMAAAAAVKQTMLE